ncbi:hypothetical protein [Kitasatospora sp. GAS204B]|uniref:hypothetical protein n=1 Tax=unclassified Kitasatospora TaxID=2633591 RepID=UPI002474614B|nr:hypothetical protein [Kitasatospora sp. GAS204B]MDH6122394.1 hypothetical protein [Kitasatospora sp. GAS204B]
MADAHETASGMITEKNALEVRKAIDTLISVRKELKQDNYQGDQSGFRNRGGKENAALQSALMENGWQGNPGQNWSYKEICKEGDKFLADRGFSHLKTAGGMQKDLTQRSNQPAENARIVLPNENSLKNHVALAEIEAGFKLLDKEAAGLGGNRSQSTSNAKDEELQGKAKSILQGMGYGQSGSMDRSKLRGVMKDVLTDFQVDHPAYKGRIDRILQGHTAREMLANLKEPTVGLTAGSQDAAERLANLKTIPKTSGLTGGIMDAAARTGGATGDDRNLLKLVYTHFASIEMNPGGGGLLKANVANQHLGTLAEKNLITAGKYTPKALENKDVRANLLDDISRQLKPPTNTRSTLQKIETGIRNLAIRGHRGISAPSAHKTSTQRATPHQSGPLDPMQKRTSPHIK